MAERYKLQVPDAAGVIPNPTDADRIPSTCFPVKPRLWSVRLLHDDHGMFRRRWAAELLGLGDIVAHSRTYLFNAWGRAALELEIDAGKVPI